MTSYAKFWPSHFHLTLAQVNRKYYYIYNLKYYYILIYYLAVLCRYKYASAAERIQLEKEKQKERRRASKKKKTWENVARVKPEKANMSREKVLHGVARRGVIDFFNAIEKHQSEHKRKLEDAGPTEFRKSKVIKNIKEQDVLEKLDEQTVIPKVL